MNKRTFLRNKIRHLYIRLIRNHIKDELTQQRIKLIFWDIFPYFVNFFSINNLSFSKKVQLIIKFLIIDWRLIHGHKPIEIMAIWSHMDSISHRLKPEHKYFIEAGCYNGGSSCKFSFLINTYGWNLKIYDSFEGVEKIGPEAEGFTDYSGTYSASKEIVNWNISKYGCLDNVELIKGWFADTIVDLNYSPSIIYIDCDLIKGTGEVIAGSKPMFNKYTTIFSQDYMIQIVGDYLRNKDTWEGLKLNYPEIKYVGHMTARISWLQQ